MRRGARELPSLPRERIDGVWPQLLLDDKHFMRTAAATQSEIEQMRRRNHRANYRRALRIDLTSAVPKGLALGLVAFGLWFGLLPAIHLWWVGTGITLPTNADPSTWRAMASGLTPTPGDWARALPWVAPIIAAAVVSVLLGAEAGVLLICLGCVALGVPEVPAHLLSFAGLLVAGTLLRCLFEVLPEREGQA
jgi:hypothetical protein